MLELELKSHPPSNKKREDQVPNKIKKVDQAQLEWLTANWFRFSRWTFLISALTQKK
jgi:hypothetical protein